VHFFEEPSPKKNQVTINAATVSKLNHRFHRDRFIKYPFIDNEATGSSDQSKFDEYAKAKLAFKSEKSVLLESEILGELKNRKSRTAFPATKDKDINKWKYSFHSQSMIGDMSRLVKARSSNIDLSKF
jgi:hypothetical protein